LILIRPLATQAQDLPNRYETRRLSNIEVLGSNTFEPQTLLNTLQIVRVGEPYESGALEADIEINLKGFLKQHGFITPEVKWEEISRREREVEVRIHVEEGLQYRLSKLELKGMVLFSRDELLSHFNLNPGDVVDFSAIRDGLDKIKERYGNWGHINVSYLPEQMIDRDTQAMTLIFTIEEGFPFHIAHVGFVGCKNQVEEDRLRSIVAVRAGELFRSKDLDASVRAINNLGLYKPIGEKDYKVSVIDETEGLLRIVFRLQANN